ncbi:hypothetical protein [uncultured Christiangramia sp.]|uniref:hypothetical protein n=1 Tax=Christiangramia sp. 3-2217-3z TaxID=3417564 RepID=UPI0026376D55|nr:hypothetical protein [uncultured Christiangramia sp.]
MKKIFLILIVLITCSCSEQKQNHTKNLNTLVDTTFYKAEGFNMRLKLDLLSNDKFTFETSLFSCFGGGEKRKFYGSYLKSKDKIKLKPENVEIEIYPEDSPMENPTIKNLPYGLDSLRIKTNFKIVNWNKNEYLLSNENLSFFGFEENNTDYDQFAYYYNIGSEPDENGWYLVHKREKKDTNEVNLDLNQIPPKYRKQFLNKPIVAKITDIKNIPETQYEGEHWLITVNKGKNDGVNKNIIFQTENMEMFIEPDSIFENTTIGKSYLYNFKKEKYPVGTILKTKWEN